MTQDNRSGNRGAYLAEGDADGHIVREWLKSQDRTADGYSDPEHFIGAVVDARYWWVVIAKAGRVLTLPWFDRLFRAAIETDTQIWTADDNTEFGVHLFCTMMDNWEFLAPYMPESSEGSSSTSLRDALSRIEARIRTNADVAIPEFTEIHEVIVKQQASRLASLSLTERELYDAASEDEAFGGKDLCRRTRTHSLNSRTKQCLSTLVKLGLLRKAAGRRGYLRTPAKS